MKIDVPTAVSKDGPDEWCFLVHDLSNLQMQLWIWVITWLALTNRGWWKWHRQSQAWFLRGASMFHFCDLQGNSKSFIKEIHPPAEITWRVHEEREMLCVYMERGEMDSRYSSWDLLPSCSPAKTPDTGTHHPRHSHLLEIPKDCRHNPATWSREWLTVSTDWEGEDARVVSYVTDTGAQLWDLSWVSNEYNLTERHIL